MDLSDLEGLDKAMALMMVDPGTMTVHSVIREARSLRTEAHLENDGKMAALLDGLHKDALSLHDSVVTLESDPEIVKRNMLARMITAVFPVINGIEGFRNFPQKSLWELFMSGLAIAAEISTGTQYLEAANLGATAHFERDLVKLEGRIIELAVEEGFDASSVSGPIEGYFDSLRKADIPSSQKPLVPFLFWLLISIVSYKRLKTDLSKKAVTVL